MRKSALSKCITQTIWFERLVRGVDMWVGIKSRTDQDISIEVIKLLMDNMEAVVKRDSSMVERRNLTKRGPYFIRCFVD